jgi:hypothetical protein
MIERIYRCNFCRDQKDLTELYGVYWYTPATGGSRFRFVHPRESENHICHGCAQNISDLIREIPQKEETAHA